MMYPNLRYKPNLLTPPPKIQVPNVSAVDGDGAMQRVIKAEQERTDGRLARAALATNGND